MSFEEEFDRKINQKMDEASFPFDEANWAKASSMLDMERKVGGGAVGFSKFYVPVVAIGLVSLGLVALSYFNSEKEPMAAVTKLQTAVIVPQNNSVQNEEPAITKESVVVSTSNKSDLTAVSETSDEATNTRNTEERTEPSQKLMQPKTQAVNNERLLKTTAPDANQPTETSANAIVSTETAFRSANEEKPVTTQTEEPLNKVPQNTAPIEKVAENEIVQTENSNPGQVIGAIAPVPVITSNNKELGNNNNDAVNTTINTLQTENPIIEQMVLRELYLSTIEPELVSIPFVLLPRYDDDYFKKMNKHLTHFMNLEAGAFYNLGWANTISSHRDGQGANWFAGLNYGYYLSKKVALGMGLQVFNISHIDQPFYEASSKQYNFGSSASGTMVTSNQLYFAAVPLKLYFSLNNKNKLGVGFNAAYAFYATSTVNSYTETQETIKTQFPAQTTKGVYQGTNQFNYLVSAFYKLQLSKRFALNAEYTYGLTDLFKNTGNVTNAEKPQGVRLSINYTLFEK